MFETQMSWIKRLPLALLRIRTQPWSDLGVSADEMMFGLPFLTLPQEGSTYEEGEANAKKYVMSIAQTLEGLRHKGAILQLPPWISESLILILEIGK